MPNSGSGTITPLASPAVPTIALAGLSSCLTLADYAAILGLDECGVYGVQYDGQEVLACGEIWTQHQRNNLRRYLSQAQTMIETRAGFPLCPTYVVEEPRAWRFKLHTKWTKVIEVGQAAVTVVASGQAVSHATDPAVVGPVAVTFTDESQVHVYYPGTEVEIQPSLVQIAGGLLTIYIPRCRMVKPALWDTPREGLELTDVTNFQTTVDIKRIYTDTTVQATARWKSRCVDCTEETTNICEDLLSPRRGFMGLGVNTLNCAGRGYPDYVTLRYLAGESMAAESADAVIRLAHSLMPEGPCGCDPAVLYWKRDRNVPDFIEDARARCLWGVSDGAYQAWKFALDMRVMRMTNF